MENEIQKQGEGGALAVAAKINDMFGVTVPQIPVDAPLPVIKIMRESPQFELPDGTIAKELTGHIIHYTNANQYYLAEFGKGESPVPDCFSANGITPDGGTKKKKGPCHDCELNKFESGKDGKSKACANTIRLYLLLDGDIMGSMIKAPPSSMGRKESLLKWLTSAPNVANKAGCGSAYQAIKVKFKLHTKEFASKFSASVLDLETVRVLDPKNENDMAELCKLAGITKAFHENYLGRIAKDMATEHQDPGEQPAADDGLPKDSPNDDVPI